MSVDAKVVLLAILNALLLSAGIGLQKLNAVRGANPVFSGLLLLSFICFAPTFFIANFAFKLGGRVAVFVPISALSYVLTAVLGCLAFREQVAPSQGLGLLLILGGVALVARG